MFEIFNRRAPQIKSTQQQLDCLITKMENPINLGIAMETATRQQIDDFWESAAVDLNAIPGGIEKTSRQWCKVRNF